MEDRGCVDGELFLGHGDNQYKLHSGGSGGRVYYRRLYIHQLIEFYG